MKKRAEKRALLLLIVVLMGLTSCRSQATPITVQNSPLTSQSTPALSPVTSPTSTIVASPTVSATPLSAAMHKELGDSFYDQGNYEAAITHFSEAIRLDEKDIEAWNSRGNAYRKSVNCDPAIFDHSQAIRLEPKYVGSLRFCGVSHMPRAFVVENV